MKLSLKLCLTISALLLCVQTSFAQTQTRRDTGDYHGRFRIGHRSTKVETLLFQVSSHSVRKIDYLKKNLLARALNKLGKGKSVIEREYSVIR